MRFSKLLLFTIIISSCKSTPHEKEQPQIIDENWQVTKETNQTYSYTKSGLIDTTYRIDNIYVNGKVEVVLKFLINRDYDTKNNLISEKTYQLLTKNELTEEKRMRYNAKNNPIEEISKFDNEVNSITKILYNDFDQEIRRFNIRKSLEADPQDWNLDSAVVHTNDKKPKPLYDTTIVLSFYDRQGNLAKELYCNSAEIVVESLLTTYSNGNKSFTYALNAQSDTISITKYEIEGTLIKETREDKGKPFSNETIWYEGGNKVKYVYHDSEMNWRQMETYKYDEKGNGIQIVSYK